MVRKGFSAKVAFELKGRKGLGKYVFYTNSKCMGPEVGLSLVIRGPEENSV